MPAAAPPISTAAAAKSVAAAPIESLSPTTRGAVIFICFTLLLGIGIALRLTEFLRRPAFWTDEAALAMNVVDRPIAAISRPMIQEQVAPYGFLLLTKFETILFGTDEWVLRLIPLIAALAALPLIFFLARRFFGPIAALFALALAAVAPRLIYYAGEFKQYSSDAALALVLIFFTSEVMRRPPERRPLIILGLAGIIAPWFSLPSIFILATAGLVLIVHAGHHKNSKRALTIGALGLLWVLSFAAEYLIFLRSSTSHSDYLQSFWAGQFAPFPPRSLHDLHWYPANFFLEFADPGGWTLKYLAGALMLLGAVALWRRNKFALALLVGPGTFLVLASMVHMYPAVGRATLFMIPLLAILIGIGGGWIFSQRRPLGIVLALALMGVLIWQPARGSITHALRHADAYDIHALLRYVHDHQLPGDTLYLDPYVIQTYPYYAPRVGALPANVVTGKSIPTDPETPALANLIWAADHATRLWVVVGHYLPSGKETSEDIHTRYLDAVAKRVDSWRGSDYTLYLYQINSGFESNTAGTKAAH
jgi:hypothetical protein